MKKFINQIENVELEMLEGIAKAHPDHLKKLPDFNVLVRAEKKEGKVALISGGGSGHEPAHGGYVGKGMLDAAVAGAVFTSPTPDQVEGAIRAVATDAGVLLVIKNYTGDVMNFEMAAEMAEMDGIKCASVVTNDDVAVQDSLYTTGRRGVAGTIFVHKIAGAKAEQGASLEEVQAVAQKVIDNVRTMGAALAPCTVPAAGKPGFEIGEDEMEVGIGIHGEPGTHKEKITAANELVDHLLDKILADIDYAGKEVAVLINGAGATPLMELYIINNRVADVLAAKGVKVYKTLVGNYMTSLEMIKEMSAIIQQNKDFLTELDMPIGDSDHGINLARGFQAVEAKIPTMEGKDAAFILKTVGMTLVSTVGGASGPLYGTAFMKASTKVVGKMELGKDDLIAMLHEAVEGIKMRGKSTTGEQTMLDAMVPALEALKETGDLKAALAAAEEGVEKTKDMIATKGRASYLGERSLGHQDPGATSFTLLFSVIAKNA